MLHCHSNIRVREGVSTGSLCRSRVYKRTFSRLKDAGDYWTSDNVSSTIARWREPVSSTVNFSGIIGNFGTLTAVLMTTEGTYDERTTTE